MRYLSLAEALVIAEYVTGIPARTLVRVTRVGLLDSALNAPRASFGGIEFYPTFHAKAAVLLLRIARNHPLHDGNKRLAWLSLRMFCELNGHILESSDDAAVELMTSLAAGALDEGTVELWIQQHTRPSRRGE